MTRSPTRPRIGTGLTPFSIALLVVAVVILLVDPLTLANAVVRVLLALLLGITALRLAMREREVRRVIDDLARLSAEDALTGLGNQAEFHRRLDAELHRARRYGHRLSIAILDVDGLKRVNDTHGHQRGDELLRAFGSALHGAVRASDVAFRIGGDEFAVIMPETGRREATRAAERMKRLLAERALASFEATVSVGVAEFPDAGSTGDAIVKAADDAMYAEKAERKRVPA